MTYLLDTNVVTELTRPRPSPGVVAWLRQMPDAALYLSVLTLGEIREGVETMPDGGRKEQLRLWLEQELPAWFESQLLAVSAGVADLGQASGGGGPARPGH